MTLPNSSYEELLDQVRQLTHETMLLQEHLSSNVNPADVNHNLSLVQKNYEKGIELADSVIRQCEQNQQQQQQHENGGSHTSSTSDLSNIQRPWSRMSEGSNIGAKIPPGDLQSRLIAWRDKNRHLLPLDKGGGGVVERRRPVSLHGPREEILFGSAIGGCTWRPASHLLGRAQSAEPTTRHQEAATNQQPMIHDARLQPASNDRKTEESEQRITDISIPESYTKSRHSYEIDGSSTEDDNCPSSSLLSQKMPKTREAWPIKQDSWSPSHSAGISAEQIGPAMHNDPAGTMNFTLGVGPASGMQGQRRLGAKLDVVYSLLSMLGSSEGREDMSATLLSMSNSVESCEVMRQSGCLPLLIQLIHAPGQDPETRERASRALYNIVHAKNDEKSSRREARVLRFLEQLRDYCQALRQSLESRQPIDDMERHPSATIAALMKLSFDDSHRHAMCQLGGLHSVAELVEVDHAAHGTNSSDSNCITLRRYSGMALTNLTFGDSNNKALLCSFREFMKALVSQLASPSDDLRQVTASVLRNLSWRADSSSKQTLREVGAVVALMKAAMEGRKESTLKSILSALWNLSAHCSTNKMDICAVEGALAFLVDMLSFNAPSKTLAIVENAGGILRNVSSHIAVRDDYRAIVRERGCLQVLLRQLRSPSLTVVSNACGALWNLSARCPQDQLMLWDLGAVPMLRSLVHSKHKMISMGSSAALKNLLSARPNGSNIVHLDSTARGLGLPTLPSLTARRQKALEQEIDQNLSETCENIEPSTSPVNKENKFTFKLDQTFLDASNRLGQCLQSKVHPPVAGQLGSSGLKYGFTRSESRESMRSVTSTQSDTIFEKVNRHARNGITPLELQMKQQSTSMHSSVNLNNSGASDLKGTSEKKYTLRYMNAIPERLKPGEPLPDFRGLKCTDSTISWATTPNQEINSQKASLNSSIEDKLSLSNSSESNSFNFSGTKVKSNLVNNFANYSLHLQNLNKIVSPIHDPLIDYNDPKYGGHSSDEDKQSSAYFTGTDQEHNSVKTYCAEGSSNPASLDSSRTSSASDLHEEVKLKSHLKNITGQNMKLDLQSIKLNPRTDSLRSITTSESTLTLEAGRSLESDSAIFEEDQKQGESSGVPSLSSLDDEPSYKRNNSEGNLVRYRTNASLNDIEVEDVLASKNKVQLVQSFDQQQLQDEEDFSELTNDNDYHTVQETYTIENDDNQDDCTISQTLTYVSVDDNTFPSPFNKTESTDHGIMHTANSQSFNTFDSIEKTDQVLPEICTKTGISSPGKLLSPEPHENSKLIVNGTTNTVFSVNNDEILKSLQMNGTGKCQEEYRRQRDPDAMIASLDRLTATLVQQSEAMRERDLGVMKSSLVSTADTWNEDSPNDVSFPSMSGSVPMVPSFKSDLDDEAGSITELAEDLNNSFSMTDSKIIEREAIKLAEAVSAEVNQTSLTSTDLDAINPPSNMGSLISLTASTGVITDNVDNSEKDRESTTHPSVQYSPRKKSLPVGVVARRALGQGQSRTASLENLLNECNANSHSQLENVKPPSLMDELLDGADMENSLLSVASITSETADNKDLNSDRVFDFIKPVANVLSMTCRRYVDMHGSGTNSLTDCLDNINPPSLFNEVTRMDEPNVEENSHCNDTLCIDVDFDHDDATHFVFDERIEEIANDTDEAVTPISSECCSSVESTPKKSLNKSRLGHLTPKQKRQLVKERYKTYTIAAEREKKEAEERKRQEQMEESGSNDMSGTTSPKLTPKQRRQGDRARFQTQVLGTPVSNATDDNDRQDEDEAIKTTTQIPVKSGIPTFRKFGSGNKTFKMSKIPDTDCNDRFRTMTLSDKVLSNGQKHQELEEAKVVSSADKDFEQADEFFYIPKTENRNTSPNYENATFSFNETSFKQNSQAILVNGVSAKLSNILTQETTQNLDCAESNHASEDYNDSQTESDSDSSEKLCAKVSGPRIVKPGGGPSRDSSTESNGADKQESEIPKGIRGRRKPLYSKANLRNSTPQCSPAKQVTSLTPISRSNSSPMVRGTRATTLRQHNSLQKTTAYAATNNGTPEKRTTPIAKRSSIPQKSTSATFGYSAKKVVNNTPKVESPIKPLERQGTFTKDEPEMENTPLVLPSTPCKGKFTKPISSAKTTPKTSPINSKLKTPTKTSQRSNLVQPKLIKMNSAEKIPTTGIPMMAKRSVTNLSGQVVKSPNSQISSPNESGIPRKISLGQRSDSNSSIVSTTSTQGTRNKMVKETTSKIASLWKKVEENKKHQKFEKPDGRQWILPKRESTMIETSNRGKEQTCNLYRSSTFEGVTKDSDQSSQNLISNGNLTTA